MCLRQAARSSGDNEFRGARLFTFTLLALLRFVIVLLLVLVIGSAEEDFEIEPEKSEQATTFETISNLVVSLGSERQDLLCL